LVLALHQEGDGLELSAQVFLKISSFEKLNDLVWPLDLEDLEPTRAGIDIPKVLSADKLEKVSRSEVAALPELHGAEVISRIDDVSCSIKDQTQRSDIGLRWVAWSDQFLLLLQIIERVLTEAMLLSLLLASVDHHEEAPEGT